MMFLNRIDRQSTAALVLLWIGTTLVAVLVDPFWTSVAVSVVTWMYLCVAWNIVGGIVGQVSFGHAAFFGIGAYTSTYLASNFGISPWIGMAAGAMIAGLASLGIGFLPFRWGLSPLVFALFTLAFAYALEYCVSGIDQLGGTNGLFVPMAGGGLWSLRFNEPAAYLIVASALLSVLLMTVALLHRSRVGLFWRAIHDNEAAAAAAGVHTFRTKVMAFALSALFTAAAGTLHAQHVGFVDPPSVFGLEITVYILLFAVVGGSGTLLGPLLGPLLLIPLSELLRLQLGHTGAGLHHLVFGLALMMAILAWPGGIMSALNRFGVGRGALLRPVHLPQAGLEVVAHSVPAEPAGFLKADRVSKDFGGVAALRDVSFDLRPGEILGVIGPNGAGKTTLFSILSGFLPPSGGRVTFRGENLAGIGPEEICRRGIARTFQTTQSFATLTVLECVYMAALVRNDAAGAALVTSGVLRDVGMWNRRDVVAANLTLAEHRRLEIARALATQPTIILLDEIMAGLTPREVGEAVALIERVRAQGITVVVIEHNVRAVMNLSDRILVLDAGEVIALGAPSAVATDARVLEAYLGRAEDGALLPT